MVVGTEFVRVDPSVASCSLCQGRFAPASPGPKGPSLTAVARAALPAAGRDGGIGPNTIEQRDSLLRSEVDEERTEKTVRHVSGPKCQICTRSLSPQESPCLAKYPPHPPHR